jgi:hypothetical protein
MRVLAIVLVGLATAPAVAQVDLKNPSTEIRRRCLAEAVENNDVRAGDGQTFYTCVGATAKNWFDVSADEKVVHDKNGVFAARYYAETGYCAHQTEDGAGKPTSAYVCEVVVGKAP